MKIVEMFFDEDNDMLVLEEPDGTVSRFNHYQLREAKEVLHQYDHANFHPSSEENEKAFELFAVRMGKTSPEVHDTLSPYLN